ncbi:MAG: hypothetical protein LGR52_07315 [Candidatus Thiosymbion ectosymbiont of Robbea hypermnestra]|nr:hypothetical protein [Candidatus Thiosymbion ectosymbiont of Robbea hypermnestra]
MGFFRGQSAGRRRGDQFVASLLYYFGILTLGGMTPFGELRLTIPNLVIRRLYAETIRELLLPEGREIDLARRAAEALYQRGELVPRFTLFFALSAARSGQMRGA